MITPQHPGYRIRTDALPSADPLDLVLVIVLYCLLVVVLVLGVSALALVLVLVMVSSFTRLRGSN